MNYRKFPECDPDLFVRRNETPRFNSKLSDDLLEAHLARVFVGRRYLTKVKASRDYLRLWESQYFAELEYLIYNAPKPARFVKRLIDDWRYFPSGQRYLLATMRIYGAIGVQTRDRCYLILRIARRFALLIIPKHLKPDFKASDFHQASLSEVDFEQLCLRLKKSIIDGEL